MVSAKSARLLCVSRKTKLVTSAHWMRFPREKKKACFRRRTQSECSPSKHNLPGTNTSCFSADDEEEDATTSSKDSRISLRAIYVCCDAFWVLKCILDFSIKISCLSFGFFRFSLPHSHSPFGGEEEHFRRNVGVKHSYWYGNKSNCGKILFPVINSLQTNQAVAIIANLPCESSFNL